MIYLSFLRLLPPEPKRAELAAEGRAAMAPIIRRDVGILVLMVAMVVLFRIGYKQSGNVIALWVADFTDRSFDLLGRRMTIPATWFQSINPLLIILGTPLLIRFWRRRKIKETTAHLLRRMAVGCVIATLAMLVMVLAALASGPDGERVSSLWVVGYFMLLTLGELYVIPVGLTLINPWPRSVSRRWQWAPGTSPSFSAACLPASWGLIGGSFPLRRSSGLACSQRRLPPCVSIPWVARSARNPKAAAGLRSVAAAPSQLIG